MGDSMEPELGKRDVQFVLEMRHALEDAFGEEVLIAARVGGLLVRGRTQDQIAEELNIEPVRVDAAVQRLRNAGVGA